MKKVSVVLSVFLVALFFITACSKDDKKKGSPAPGPDNNYHGFTISVAYVNIYTVEVDNLLLAPSQEINLKAEVKNASGNIVANMPVNWTCSEALGSFINSTGAVTRLNVSAGGGDDFFIKAELGGIVKTIPVIVDTLNVKFEVNNDNQVLKDKILVDSAPTGGGTPNTFKAILTRSNGDVDTNSIIVWNQAVVAGEYSPQFSYSGEECHYILRGIVGNVVGEINLNVMVNGKEYVSEKTYPIVTGFSEL